MSVAPLAPSDVTARVGCRGDCADRRYSDRSAFNGEIELARSAGTMDAISAAHASTATATRVTAGLNGLVP